MVWGTFHRTSNPTEYFTRLQREITTRLLCNEFFILAALLLSPQPCLPLPSHLVVFGERFSAGERARPPSRLSSLTHLSAFPPQPSGSVRRLKPPTAELSPPHTPRPPPPAGGTSHTTCAVRKTPSLRNGGVKAVFLSAMGPKRFKTGGVASAGAADKSWEAALVAARLQEVKAAKGGQRGGRSRELRG